MKNSIFITGASGYIGGLLLLRLNPDDYKHIYCLGRTESNTIKLLSRHTNFTFIKGSLFDINSYESFLKRCGLSVHLAGATGKVIQEEYFTVNAHGTEFFVKQCERLGVKRFLHISTIAVRFKDIKHYPYARSKKEGEFHVYNSGMKYTMVRPTNVIGAGSSIWKSFTKLASLPFLPIFGNGKSMIQPIYIDDLINCLIFIINNDIFNRETFDLGGPQIISIEDFLIKVHEHYYHKSPLVLHIPLAPLIFTLGVLEKVIYTLLPLNRGQLTSFMHDSLIEENRLFLNHKSSMKNVDEMIESSIKKGEKKDIDLLKKECSYLSMYLISRTPSSYVIEKYCDAHKTDNTFKNSKLNVFDNIIIFAALLHPIILRLADAYTRIFNKRSVLRKKLILLLAILESVHPYSNFDTISGHAGAKLYIDLIISCLKSGVALIAGSIIFMPIHLITSKMIWGK